MNRNRLNVWVAVGRGRLSRRAGGVIHVVGIDGCGIGRRRRERRWNGLTSDPRGGFLVDGMDLGRGRSTHHPRTFILVSGHEEQGTTEKGFDYLQTTVAEIGMEFEYESESGSSPPPQKNHTLLRIF